MTDDIDIKSLRRKLDWKQEKLAAFLGVATSSISHMENGRLVQGPVRRLLELLRDAVDAGEVECRFPEFFREEAA